MVSQGLWSEANETDTEVVIALAHEVLPEEDLQAHRYITVQPLLTNSSISTKI